MTDDLNALLGGLGGSPKDPTPPGAGDPTPSTPPTDPTPGTPPAGTPATPPTPPATPTPPVPGEDPAKDNTVIKQMRESIAQHKKEAEQRADSLLKIAKANGFEKVEDYLKKLDEDEIAKVAKEKDISPELEKVQRQLAQMQQDAEQERQRSEFFFKLNQLKTTQGITDDQVLQFAEQVKTSGINLLTSNVDMNLLYKAMNIESYEAKIRENERTKVLETIKKQGMGAYTTIQSGGGDAPKKGMQDLYKDLANLGIK